MNPTLFKNVVFMRLLSNAIKSTFFGIHPKFMQVVCKNKHFETNFEGILGMSCVKITHEIPTLRINLYTFVHIVCKNYTRHTKN